MVEGIVQELWHPKDGRPCKNMFLPQTPLNFQIAATGKRNGVTGSYSEVCHFSWVLGMHLKTHKVKMKMQS